jgi:hypothetical protein
LCPLGTTSLIIAVSPLHMMFQSLFLAIDGTCFNRFRWIASVLGGSLPGWLVGLDLDAFLLCLCLHSPQVSLGIFVVGVQLTCQLQVICSEWLFL